MYKIIGLISIAFVATFFSTTSFPQTNFSELGTAPVATPEDYLSSSRSAKAGGNIIQAPVEPINSLDRDEVIRLYHEVYRASENDGSNINWTGRLIGCDWGKISTSFLQDMLWRINYFRAMVGVPSDVILTEAKNNASQASSLIMSAKESFGPNESPHEPQPSWPCFSSLGYEGASKGNIYRGVFNTDAIDGYIFDPGANNTAVGHRRWLLYPPAVEMGIGSIPPHADAYRTSNTVYVVGDFGPRPNAPEWAAWPNPGFFPYDLLPERWSFSYPEGNFSQATVTMSSMGSDVPLSLEPYQPGAGDNTLVWVPTNLPSGMPNNLDKQYQVTISNVYVNNQYRTFNYDVTVIDPYSIGTLTVVGPDTIPANTRSTFTLESVSAATHYRIQQADAVVGQLEGAENGITGIIDNTDTSYNVISTADVATGNKAFHLTIVDFASQHIILDKKIIPSSNSILSFKNKFRFVTDTSSLQVGISNNDGGSWQIIWTKSGYTGSQESYFGTATTSLADFADQVIQLRFTLDAQGSVYNGTGSHLGLYIDDIQISDSTEAINIKQQIITGTQFSIEPQQPARDLVLWVKAGIGEFFLGDSLVKRLNVNQGTERNLILESNFEND